MGTAMSNLPPLPQGAVLDMPPLPQGATLDAPLDVNRTPIELPPPRDERTYGGTGRMPAFTVAPDTYTRYEREASARGVDITSELEDGSIRRAFGFSPNDQFSADFLAKKLAEKTGLPANQLVQFAPNGSIEFYNPETKRFNPVDSSNATMNDLRDMYGPVEAMVPAVIGGIGGAVGGPISSIGFGAVGAFIGEIGRLQHGKTLGVHDLTNEQILDEGIEMFLMDAAFGTAGIAVGELRRLGRKFLNPEGLTPEHAKNILDNLGAHEDELNRLNDILEKAGSKNRFVLDPVADAGDTLGIELRESAAKSTIDSRASRATEIKANAAALQDVARILNRLDATDPNILSTQGARERTAPAQRQLREERQRIQDNADNKLSVAEQEAKDALDELGTLNRREAGEELKATVNNHSIALETTKDDNWLSYQRSIGQKGGLDEGYTEASRYQSNIQVPISPEIAAAHKALRLAMRESLLKTKAQGGKVLKGTQPTTTVDSPIIGLDGKPVSSTTTTNRIDLAVLDDDIKEVRDAIRRGDPGFSGRKMRKARDDLVKLRNEYLLKEHPEILKLLQDAEAATTVYKNFVKESVFARVLKRNADGSMVMGDVDAFRVIMKEDSGEMMRELVAIARTRPGGVEGLQAMAFKFYKAGVTPEGSSIMSLDLHNKFISKNEEVMTALFGDPRFLKFGELGARVAKAQKHAQRVTDILNRSPLAKFGGIAPEKMGKAVFQESVDEKAVRQTLLYLDNQAVGREVGASFRDSVGRHIYTQITSDGVLNASKISTLIEKHGAKLELIYGKRYVNDLRSLRHMITLNVLTQSGKEIPSSSLTGMMARALITPPLTRRGRAQTLVEKWRKQAMDRMVNQAVRDPDILRAIIANRDRDVTTTAVLNVLGQTGGAALAMDEE